MSGPLNNKPGCYGLLESGKDIVRARDNEEPVEPSSIIKPVDMFKP